MSETSVVAKAVASVGSKELMTNEVPFVIVPTAKFPVAAAPVDPIDPLVKNIKELDVTAVVLTVTVPAVRVDWPTEALDPAAMLSLFPAVESTKSPLVAVISPKTAVMLVVAVTEPGAVSDVGRESVTVAPVAAVVN